MKGDLSERQFFKETGKALIRSAGSYAATYCTVAIGITASVPVIMFIAAGGYVLADLALNKYQEYNEKQHLNLDDILIKVPFEIRNNTTIFDQENIKTATIHDIENAEGVTLYDLEKDETLTIWDMDSNLKKTIFD